MALNNTVEFPGNSVGIVSSKWLNEDSSMTLWQTYTDPSKHKVALLMHEVPGETWTMHDIKIWGTAGRFFSQNCKEFKQSIACMVSRKMCISARPDTLILFPTVDYEKARYKAKMAETNLIITSEPEELDRSQRSR